MRTALIAIGLFSLIYGCKVDSSGAAETAYDNTVQEAAPLSPSDGARDSVALDNTTAETTFSTDAASLFDSGSNDSTATETAPLPEAASTADAFFDASFDSRVQDASDAQPDERIDAGPPPSYCIAPCVWRALIACTPPPIDVCDQRGYTTVTASEALCDPESGWFKMSANFSSAGQIVAVGNANGVCFQIRYGGKSPLRFPILVNSEGSIYTQSGTGTSVRCSDDGQEYELDPTLPECAAWVDPALPYVQIPAFECASTVAGECESATTLPWL